MLDIFAVDNAPYTGDKFADIKKRLRAIGYDGRLTIEMLQMGAALLRLKGEIDENTTSIQ